MQGNYQTFHLLRKITKNTHLGKLATLPTRKVEDYVKIRWHQNSSENYIVI